MTSSAVKGLPSCHTTSFLSLHVTDLPSCASPPLSRLGISAARIGTKLASGSNAASGSQTTREASKSLPPEARWVLRMVGACHQSRRSLPPPPRLVGTKSATGGAVCAWAGVEVASKWLRKGPDNPRPIMYRRKARRSAMPCATRCTHARKAASSRLMTPSPLLACRASDQHAGYLPIPGEPTVTQAQGDVTDTGSAHPSKSCRSVHQLPALIV